MNTRLQAFQDFLATQSLQIPVFGFILNLALAALLAYVLARVYVKYGASLSNRAQFARNFVLLAMTTTLVITIVKTSLALSLGLVGALSIVRFRAAIKEPEELTYLFLNIAIGLGLGADQRLITVVAFALIIGAIWVKKQKIDFEDGQNLYLTVTSQGERKIELNDVVEALKPLCVSLNLKRYDENAQTLEASFLVAFKDFEGLNQSKARLKELDQNLQISFLDHKNWMS